jgi:DNA-binding GntR family transcriptional regulator
MLVSRVYAPIREQTINNLRNAIIQGEFKQGERLFERELCKRMGVSRTSVREALRHLESEGLVSVIPQKGPIVAKVTIEEAEDIYQVREMLEGLACRLFAEQATSSAISALSRSLDVMEKYSQERDVTKLVAEKDNFYKIILEGCGNKVVCSFIRSLHARINFLRATSLSYPERSFQALKEIRSILEAIRRRDSDAAWNASTYHVRKAKSAALRVLHKIR